jgi:hypothetical protein
MRYFYHPESDSLWEQKDNEPFPNDGLVMEISMEEYQHIKSQQKGTYTMPMQGGFDANQIQPKQIGESHPVGKFQAVISNTEIAPTKDGTGGMFIVTFKTPSGEIPFRYNIWNQSDKAKEIAAGQLSALCHATGVFRVGWENDGAALRNAALMIEVGYQKGQEPSPEMPHGGYTEVKKVYDRNGNEPGKAPQAAPQTQPAGNGGWGNSSQPQQQQPTPQPQPNPPMTQQPGGWGQPAQQQPSQADPPWKR